MTEWPSYTAMPAALASGDTLLALDVSDHSASAAGTVHQVTAGNAATDLVALSGLASEAGRLMFPLRGGGEAAYNPMLASQNSVALASGTMLLAFGQATVSETIGHMSVPTGGAAAVGTTYAAYGLYTVDASYNLTLVASTASDTGLWGVDYQSYNGISVEAALSASYSKVAGQLYAVGLLWTGTGTAPQVVGSSAFAGDGGSALAAGLGAMVTGQTALPSSVTAASLSGTANAPCAVLLP